MRLLILWPDRQSAEVIRSQMEARGWDVDLRLDGRTMLPWDRTYDVLLLHLCLSGLDGLSSGDALAASWPIRPPRIRRTVLTAQDSGRMESSFPAATPHRRGLFVLA